MLRAGLADAERRYQALHVELLKQIEASEEVRRGTAGSSCAQSRAQRIVLPFLPAVSCVRFLKGLGRA